MDARVWIVAVVLDALVFAVLGGWVGTQKGRGPGEGTLLGVLFGPLGVMLEALPPTRSHY